MFVAWFTVISVFLICLFATIAVFDGIKDIDENDLADLQSQLKNMNVTDKKLLKQAI